MEDYTVGPVTVHKGLKEKKKSLILGLTWKYPGSKRGGALSNADRLG